MQAHATMCMCQCAMVCICVCTCKSMPQCACVSVPWCVYVFVCEHDMCSRLLHDKIQRVISCSACLICRFPKLNLPTSLAANQQPDSIQIGSHLLPHHIWYSSSIPYLLLYSPRSLHSPSILGSSVFLGWAGGPMGLDPSSTLDLAVTRTHSLPLSAAHSS